MSFLHWHPVILVKRKFYNGLLNISHRLSAFERAKYTNCTNCIYAIGISSLQKNKCVAWNIDWYSIKKSGTNLGTVEIWKWEM